MPACGRSADGSFLQRSWTVKCSQWVHSWLVLFFPRLKSTDELWCDASKHAKLAIEALEGGGERLQQAARMSDLRPSCFCPGASEHLAEYQLAWPSPFFTSQSAPKAPTAELSAPPRQCLRRRPESCNTKSLPLAAGH